MAVPSVSFLHGVHRWQVMRRNEFEITSNWICRTIDWLGWSVQLGHLCNIIVTLRYTIIVSEISLFLELYDETSKLTEHESMLKT